MSEEEILWRFYQDHITHARHLETLRSTTATVLVAVAAGILGLLGTVHAWPLTWAEAPLTVLLVILGSFGGLFAAKYHERISFHLNRAEEYRDQLDRRLPGAGIRTGGESADLRTKARHSVLYDRRLWHLWVDLHLLITLIGLILTAMILMNPGKASTNSSTAAPTDQSVEAPERETQDTRQ